MRASSDDNAVDSRSGGGARRFAPITVGLNLVLKRLNFFRYFAKKKPYFREISLKLSLFRRKILSKIRSFAKFCGKG
jgi:hypothetical protein